MLINEIVTSDGVQHIPSDGRDAILDACVLQFQTHMDPAMVRVYIQSAVDWNLSRKLVVDGNTVGFYLLHAHPIADLLKTLNCSVEDPKLVTSLKPKRGVEGIALIVFPSYRKMGFGKQLMDLPKTLGFDYVFGQQLQTLNNLPFWLKRRVLVATCDDLFVTVEVFH